MSRGEPTTEAGRTFLAALETMDRLDPCQPPPVDWAHGIVAVESEVRQQGRDRDPAIWELMAAGRWIVNIHADNIVIKERDLALWEDLGRLRRALALSEQGTR